jgi:hypothetical protein
MSDFSNYKPVTASEFYWERIAKAAEELVALQKAQQQTATPDSGLTPLRETEEMGSPLPADFPGKDALEAAGVIYLETVPRKGAELTAIPGIGAATANKILTWLKSV